MHIDSLQAVSYLDLFQSLGNIYYFIILFTYVCRLAKVDYLFWTSSTKKGPWYCNLEKPTPSPVYA